MTRLVRLWTDAAGQSQFSAQPVVLSRTAVTFIHVEETATGGTFDWHNAPCRQFVIS